MQLLLVRGHISKTKQDKPQFTTEHYIEVGAADSVATRIQILPQTPWKDIPVSNERYVHILIRRQTTAVVNKERLSFKSTRQRK